ncbi:MAG TPA: DNA-binding response regulator [Marinagarivorans sp.]
MNAKPSSDTVLVVDDSPETLSLINDTLERAGLTCLVALDPKQGLHIAQKMQPDLILLDGIMPTMSGFEFCQTCKLQPELRAIPIVFMTGMSDSENIVKAFAAGGVDYVTKPIDTQALVARIRVHLATAKIIRSAQSALDQAGQHIFAVDRQGQLLWQTPQVQESLERHNAANPGENWLDTEFWPAVERWVSQLSTPANDAAFNAGAMGSAPLGNSSLNLQINGQRIHLDILLGGGALGTNPAPFQKMPGENNADEILVRLHTNDDREDNHVLMNAFGLSQRESDVLIWIARGKTNREMGHILGISPRTINKHLEQVFKKLEVDNRTNAAAKAIPLLRR